MQSIVMRKYLTVICLLALNLNFEARALTLKEAIDTALANSPKLAAQRLKTSQEELKLKEETVGKLPDIYLSADGRNNLIVPTTPIPANMINPAAKEGDLLYMRFNTPWAMSAGVNLSYDIFNPSKMTLRRAQEKELEISRLDSRAAEENLRLDVTQAYIDCAIAQKQLEAMLADKKYYDSALKESLALYRKGQISKMSLNESEMNANTASSNASQAETSLYESKVSLLELMAMPADNGAASQITIDEDLEDLMDACEGLLSTDFLTADAKNSISLRKSGLALEKAGLQKAQSKMKYAPTVSLTGYYGYNYFNNDLKFWNKERWFGNSYVGLSVKVPVMQSFRAAKEVRRFALQEMIEKENLRSLENELNAKRSKLSARLAGALNQYEMKRRSYELSVENISAERLLARKGQIKNSELYSAEYVSHNALSEYLQAAYDLLSSKIELERLAN